MARIVALLLSLVVAAGIAVSIMPSTAQAGHTPISMKRMKFYAKGMAHNACIAQEKYVHIGAPFPVRVRRCEGWWIDKCHRWTLTRPDYGSCWLYTFLDDARPDIGQVSCWRFARFVRTPAGAIRYVNRGSTPWRCLDDSGNA